MSNLEATKDSSYTTAVMKKDGTGALRFGAFDGNGSYMYLMVDGVFRSVVVMVPEQHVSESGATGITWDSKTGYIICAPAGNRAEAAELASKLAKGTDYERVQNWN